MYTEYAVVVSAFNKIGQGPKTDEFQAYTAEGTPQQPPQDVTCTTLTSQTIRVSWSSPPLETVQGVIKGYKVFYGPSDVWYGKWTSYSLVTFASALTVYLSNDVISLYFWSYHVVLTEHTASSCCIIKLLISFILFSLYWFVIYKHNICIFFHHTDEESKDIKITSSTETHLHGLQKYTNYSLQVLAHTSGGEGVRSQPIHCQTDQDSK